MQRVHLYTLFDLNRYEAVRHEYQVTGTLLDMRYAIASQRKRERAMYDYSRGGPPTYKPGLTTDEYMAAINDYLYNNTTNFGYDRLKARLSRCGQGRYLI